MDMASSSALRTRHNLDSDGNDGARGSDLIANIQSDTLSIQNGEGEPAHKEENQGADEANEGVEEDDAFQAGAPKPVLKPKPKKGGNTVIFDEENTRDNKQDNNQDEAHDNGEGHDSDVPERGRSRFVRAQPLKSSGSLVTPIKQQRPNGGARGSTTRRRGRPSKSTVVNGVYDSTTSGSGPKRKRAELEDAYRKHLRRSTRAAAESATQQITQQTKSRRAASMPSTLGRRKAATSSASKAPTKALPMRPVKTEYEVELILDTRKKSGTTEYLVKWKGWHISHNSWEPAANLTHCAGALKEFRSVKR